MSCLHYLCVEKAGFEDHSRRAWTQEVRINFSHRGTEKFNDVVIFHQEDAMLIRLVEEVGILRWSEISKQFQHRNGKQCSER